MEALIRAYQAETSTKAKRSPNTQQHSTYWWLTLSGISITWTHIFFLCPYSISFPRTFVLSVHQPICLRWTRIRIRWDTSMLSVFVLLLQLSAHKQRYQKMFSAICRPSAHHKAATVPPTPPVPVALHQLVLPGDVRIPTSTRTLCLKGAELFPLLKPRGRTLYNKYDDEQTVAAEMWTDLLRVCGVTQHWKTGVRQRKTDPWPLQNHLTFTVSLFSPLRLDRQAGRLTKLASSMSVLLNRGISLPVYFNKVGRSSSRKGIIYS